MSFNEDDFLLLLLRQLDNCTNWDEDRYIDYILRRYEVARQLKQDVRDTFPKQAERHPNFVTLAGLTVVKGFEPVKETLATLPLQPPHQRRNLNIAAAVLVAAVIMLSLFLVPSTRPHHSMSVRDSKGVTLQLAKGERVLLGPNVVTIPTRYALLSTNAEMLQFRANPGSQAAKENTIRVPEAAMYSVTLADGTIVHLNAATALRFPFAFGSKSREVYIDGEAYFSVAKDEQRPFIVHTRKGDVRVLGTDFNINTYEEHFIVSLISGAVVVDPKKGASVQLKPCQAMVLDPVSLEMSLVDFRSEMVVGWMRGQYKFRSQPLADVCKVVERLYGMKICFDNEELAEAGFSGEINKKEPVSAFLEQLRANTKVDVQYYDEEGTMHLDSSKSREKKKKKH